MSLAIGVWIKTWKAAYGDIPVDSEGRTFHIHHRDGNRANNDIANLQAVSIQEHFDIHLAQGDYGACFLLSKQLKLSKEQKAEIGRLNAQKQIDEGTHPFLGGEMQRRTQQEKVATGEHPFLNGGRRKGPHSEATKEKIRLGNLGKNKGKSHPQSEETRRKISETRRRKTLEKM